MNVFYMYTPTIKLAVLYNCTFFKEKRFSREACEAAA